MGCRQSSLAFVMLLALLVTAGGAGGCAVPRSRLGALPFHGIFTLYSTTDASDLGRHRHGRWPRMFQTDERERGIIYTKRAGFLDVAHLRITIDWTRYYVLQVRDAMNAGDAQLTLPGMNNARLHVALHYPQTWDQQTPEARAALVQEVSIRTGQRLAYLMLTWHEAISWFGNRTVFFVDERPSAFTYDDTMSHVIGIRVAARALADESRSFDDAVTLALSDELWALGAVSPRQTDEAVRAVQGHWWANGRPLKRHYDVGLTSDVVYPWLARDISFASDRKPEPFHLPRLDDVYGQDWSGFYSAEIEPRISTASRMRQSVAGHPERFSHDEAMPQLMDVIRSEMDSQFGAEVNEPWPAGMTESAKR
ncbi:MAG TPA: DUF4056 domain-containing protein [Tepidisphaeraceae bacterium]|nr:DUF4056 domain-containing protein [Tepidisphaeraceae bacterium]